MKLKNPNKKEEKLLTYENAERRLKRRHKVLNGFESKIFPIGKQTQGKGTKILTPKQMLYRANALAQVTASNTSKNLLNEIHKIIYFLY